MWCELSGIDGPGVDTTSAAVSRSFRFIACFSCTVDPRTEQAVIMGVENPVTENPVTTVT
jgi:hypothetical protein